ERKASELQTGGGLLGDVANHIKSVGLGLRIVVLVEDLETVVDGADRTDHVVADLARDQRSEFEIGRLGSLCHRRPSRSEWVLTQTPAEKSARRTSQLKPVAPISYLDTCFAPYRKGGRPRGYRKGCFFVIVPPCVAVTMLIATLVF